MTHSLGLNIIDIILLPQTGIDRYASMVGFDAKNKIIINALYICRVCSLILREPFQLNCGHRQCKTCIESSEGYKKQKLVEMKIVQFFLK
jgi:hypothetical protein